MNVLVGNARMANDLFHLSDEGPIKVLALSLPTTIDSSEFDRLNESVLETLGKDPGDLSNLENPSALEEIAAVTR